MIIKCAEVEMSFYMKRNDDRQSAVQQLWHCLCFTFFPCSYQYGNDICIHRTFCRHILAEIFFNVLCQRSPTRFPLSHGLVHGGFDGEEDCGEKGEELPSFEYAQTRCVTGRRPAVDQLEKEITFFQIRSIFSFFPSKHQHLFETMTYILFTDLNLLFEYLKDPTAIHGNNNVFCADLYKL